MWAKILACACLIGSFGFGVTNVYAKTFTGQAVIENGNIEKAKADARREAMRAFVESEVGTYINSKTEVVDYMVVRDRIVSNSDGYVLIKKVIKEKSMGDVFVVVLDLEAGKTPVEMAVADVKAQLQMVGDDSSRSGVDIAVYDDDIKATSYWGNYLAQTLIMNGYRASSNEVVNIFLADNINKLDDLRLNAELRRIGRQEREGNSLARGRLSLLRRAQPVKTGGYRAVAELTIQIIGYESSSVDVVSRYASVVSAHPDEAEKLAKEMVVRESVEILSQQTAQTIQREQGRGTVKTTLIFAGFVNKASERQIILNAIGKAGVRVVRKSFAADGSFRVFVTANDVNNVSELVNTVVGKLQPDYPQAIFVEDDGVGALKYIVRLRG